MRLFGLREMAQRTGVAPRLLQFWADEELISPANPEVRGRGVHRLFQPVEVQLASLLAPLAGCGAPIKTLQSCALTFRACLLVKPLELVQADPANNTLMTARAMFRAANGEGINFLVTFLLPAEIAGELTRYAELVDIKPITDEAGPPLLDLADLYREEVLRGCLMVLIDLTARLAALFL
jgi:hypothetical protein